MSNTTASVKKASQKASDGPNLSFSVDPPASGQYYFGQVVTLEATVSANPAWDPATNGTTLEVDLNPSGGPGGQPLPGENYSMTLAAKPSQGFQNLPVILKGIVGGQQQASTLQAVVEPQNAPDPPPTNPETKYAGPLHYAEFQTFAGTVKMLLGVSGTSTPPTQWGAPGQIDLTLQMVQHNGTSPVPNGSGPFAIVFKKSAGIGSMNDLNFYTYNGSTFTAAKYTDDDSVAVLTDGNGKCRVTIVPGSNTDKADAFMSMDIEGGANNVSQLVTVLIANIDSGLDGALDAPGIEQESGTVVDVSEYSSFSVLLPDSLKGKIKNGTLLCQALNGKLIGGTTPYYSGFSKFFEFTNNDPNLVVITDLSDIGNEAKKNVLQYLVLDPAFGVEASIKHDFWAIQPPGAPLPPNIPPNPDGDPGVLAPTFSGIDSSDTVISGYQIGASLGVVVSWGTGNTWAPNKDQYLRVYFWLNGWYEDGTTPNSGTPASDYHKVLQTEAADPNKQIIIPVDGSNFSDYGPPQGEPYNLPVMYCQFVLYDTDKTTVLKTSKALKINFDTIPEGE